MKETIIRTWCDNHDDERVEAITTRAIAIDRLTPMELDLCESCDKEIVGPLLSLHDRAYKTTPVRPATKSASPSDQLRTCPICNEERLGRTNMEGHVYAIHLKQRPLTVEQKDCPLCVYTGSRGQDVKRHLSESHGIDWIDYAARLVQGKPLPDIGGIKLVERPT